ncbi:MAG: hypothetical protein NTY38_26385, partial [Acidobacteria bacterium]|nr:hypothetical protein [Acidobacteriota bacterium]
GRMVAPPEERDVVRVEGARRRQNIYGFGGIVSVPAYAALGEAGKRRWWALIREYNLLLHREYPNGNRLKRDLSNFDDLGSATPHYYGDNFPNGEISDFEYSRRIQQLGGKVLFEFWELPPWARRERAPVMDEYVRAMVGYCRTAKAKTGRPPEVVGIQNEIVQADEVWHEMILKLREALDREGFGAVKIHMPDNGGLKGGIATVRAIQRSEKAWQAIDFAATHVYDFQKFFVDPDGYDVRIAEWKRLVGTKPFLSTEFTVNDNAYQSRSYRTAFAQAQLYHKNMALMDASALIYCWTLLDVEQASFAATRSLFTTDRSRGGIPAASSYQLRVFGAYSRRLREGMARVEAESGNPGLLVTAWEGKPGRTVVLINRSTVPRRVEIRWPGGAFTQTEIASPYEENAVRGAAPGPVLIQPGEIVTLTNVALLH